MPGVLDTFRAFRRRLAAPRLLSPVLPARHPRRCRKCGGLLIPDRSRRYSFARPELVDAMGFQTKPGVGVSIKAGAGVIVADSSKPCCCGCACTGCSGAPCEYTVTFFDLTVTSSLCCFKPVHTFNQSYIVEFTSTPDTYCIPWISSCHWSATFPFPGHVWNATFGTPCTKGTEVTSTVLAVDLVRNGTGIGWSLHAAIAGFSDISGSFTFLPSIFVGASSAPADDCATPPGFDNSNTTIGCNLSGMSGAVVGSGGSATVTAGC